jgi:hypothetical protein
MQVRAKIGAPTVLFELSTRPHRCRVIAKIGQWLTVRAGSKKRRGFGFIVKVVTAVVIVLAVVVIVGDDETRSALLSRLRGDGRASPDT